MPGKRIGDAAIDLVHVPETSCLIIDARVAGGPIAANTTRDVAVTAVSGDAFPGGDSTNGNVGDKGSFAAAALNFTVVGPSTGATAPPSRIWPASRRLRP